MYGETPSYEGADSGPSSSNNSVRTNPTSPSPSQKPAQASAWGEAPSSPLRDVPIRQVDSNIVKGDGPVRPGKQAVDPPTIKKVVQEEGEGLPTVCPWGTGTLVTVMGYYVCLALVLGVGGTSLSAALTGTTMEAMTARDKALALLSCQTLQGAGVALILRSCLQEFAPLPPQWFHWRVPSVGQVASVAGGGITLFVACAAAISLTGVEAEATRQASVQQLVSSSDVTTELATVVGICMVTPLLEEVVFRGFFLASLGTMVSPWSAVALSSLAFATCHFNPAEFPMLFLMGLVFGGLYARSGNLAAPVMAHAAWNGLILFATFWDNNIPAKNKTRSPPQVRETEVVSN
eukprot:jgi/Mesvir1/19013/Mv12781-RA.1